MNKLYPRQAVSSLTVATLTGENWELDKQTPEHFTLVVFYRGLHCPLCRNYISELDRQHAEFEKRGVKTIAISSDIEARANQAKKDWKIQTLSIGYNLDLDVARQWGLFLSSGRGKTSIGIEEPEQFSEPGIFLIRADGALYWSSVQTMPFARPNFKEMLTAIDFVLNNNYPARGELLPG